MGDTPNKDIKVYLAPIWDCPACSACNLASASPATDEDLSDEEFEDIVRETRGLDVWQEIPDDVRKGDLVKFSNVFECSACGEVFVSDKPFLDEDDFEGGEEEDK